MKLVKISLVAAVAVASLSTASFAGATITGKTDFRWKSEMEDSKKFSKFTRERIDLDVKSKSSDGKGMVHVKFRTNGSAVGIIHTYAKYNLAGMTIGFGPRIGAGGKFSFGMNQGATVAKKVGPMTVKVGAFKADKQIVAVSGKAGPANFALDYQMGDEASMSNYLAFLTHIKVGPATLGLGYAKGMSKPAGGGDDERSILGFSVGMNMAGIKMGGGYTMAGDGGGTITEKTKAGVGPTELGSYYGSEDAKSNTYYVGASKKVAGITLGAYYAGADVDGKPKTQIKLKLVKKLNAQSKFTAFYHKKDNDGNPASSMVELRFTSKI